MSINIICAMGLNREIGYKNNLLCHLSADLQHFKSLTKNSIVVMGRNTYDSIGSPLPNRINIILTRNKKYQAPVGTFVYNSLDEVIKKYHSQNNSESDLWIIGGGEIFNQAINFADKMYLTIIQQSFDHADSYFPAFELSDWSHKIVGFQDKNDKNDYPHYYVEYTRKKVKIN